MSRKLSQNERAALRAVTEAAKVPGSLVRVTIARADQLFVVDVVLTLLALWNLEDVEKTKSNFAREETVAELTNGSAIEFVMEGEK